MKQKNYVGKKCQRGHQSLNFFETWLLFSFLFCSYVHVHVHVFHICIQSLASAPFIWCARFSCLLHCASMLFFSFFYFLFRRLSLYAYGGLINCRVRLNIFADFASLVVSPTSGRLQFAYIYIYVRVYVYVITYALTTWLCFQ